MKRYCNQMVSDYYRPFPGAKYTDNGIMFSISAPGGKSVFLRLFDREGTKISEVMCQRDKQYLFSAFVENKDLKAVYSYDFLVDSVRKNDPNAYGITGRSIFGETAVDDYVRALLPDGKLPEADIYDKHDTKDLILYKLHIRSFTMGKGAKVKYPGTFSAAAEKAPYLKKLGITGVMLQPVFDFNENMRDGRINQWGYNCRKSFVFAPKASFAVSEDKAQREFFDMVQTFHKNGIDVYMELVESEISTNVWQLKSAMRYYANIYGVDGFRVNDYMVNLLELKEDPALSMCRFFAGDGNGKALSYGDHFQNDCRRFLKGDEGETAFIAGDIKDRATERISFITDNNGFTLHDLFSYDYKHNDDNGEGGKDGTDFNFSWNCGIEGETTNKKINKLRLKSMKNAVATMFLSGGIPQVLFGDEIGHTKCGNNNSFCQDNEISYPNWENAKKNKEIFDFYKMLIEFRKAHPLFSMRRQLHESDFAGIGMPEISVHSELPWKMDYSPYKRVIAFFFAGKYVKQDLMNYEDDYYLVFNMHWESHTCAMPAADCKGIVVFDTDNKKRSGEEVEKSVTVAPRSIVLVQVKRDKL